MLEFLVIGPMFGFLVSLAVANRAGFQQQRITQDCLNADIDNRTLLIREMDSGLRASLDDLSSLYSIHAIEIQLRFIRGAPKSALCSKQVESNCCGGVIH